MDKLRILHCLVRVGSGGVEQRRLTLARELDRHRYEQRLVCTEAFGGLPPLFAAAGCRIHEVGVFHHGILDREPYRRTLQVIREFKPHLIHGAVYEGVALATVCGRLANVPIIIGEETIVPVNRNWRGHLLYRILTTMSHVMVAISPSVEIYLRDQIYVPSRKIKRIINGVAESVPPSSIVIQDLRRKLSISENDIVVGSVGRLYDAHKRLGDLLHAVALVRVRCPKLKLLIVGDGPDRQFLEALADSLGIRSQTIFTGYQKDTRQFYAVMDIFALVSRQEGLPLVVPEAMFAGLPVVATNVPGTRDVVHDGITGILVELSDINSIANAIAQFYFDKNLRKIFGLAGRERARTEFSADRYVREVDQLYQRLATQYLA